MNWMLVSAILFIIGFAVIVYGASLDPSFPASCTWTECSKVSGTFFVFTQVPVMTCGVFIICIGSFVGARRC